MEATGTLVLSCVFMCECVVFGVSAAIPLMDRKMHKLEMHHFTFCSANEVL